MLLILAISCLAVLASAEDQYYLNIVHFNDFHARFVEISPSGGVCSNEIAPCVGGFARLTTAIRESYEKEPNSLLLNGGDSFQGTLWYNIFRWHVTQEFMNLLPFDAHTLGNHEFDNGIAGLVPYLEHLKAPVVTANIDAKLEPTIERLFNNSVIVERKGRKIGIIGALISTTPTMATTEKLVFTDEVTAVRQEAEKLNKQGVDIIIVLSHCGVEIDNNIAENVTHVDIIVGAHSHALFHNGDTPSESFFEVTSPYPKVVERSDKNVLIVQAAALSQYLGELKVYFDDDGNVQSWSGNTRYLSNDVKQAEDIMERINTYLPLIEERSLEEIGTSLVELSMSNCRCGECNVGTLIADAYLDSVRDRAENGHWHYAHFAIMNRGDIRAPIESGVITFESVLTTAPFENNVEMYELRGDYVLEMLEYAVANTPFPGARMLQFSGLHAVYNGSRPVNNRVVNATIRCIECDVPRYEPLQLDKYYRMLAQDFVGQGGDGFTMISENRINVEVVGIDYDLIIKYIRKITPVFAQVEGRIDITDACLGDS